MKNQESIPEQVMSDIRRHFGFLFEREYEIVSTHYYSGYYDGYWRIQLNSPICFMWVVNDQNELTVRFMSTGRSSQLDLRNIVYFLSDGKKVVSHFDGSKKFRMVANLLQDYLDEIEENFAQDNNNFTDNVLASLKNYEKEINSSFLHTLKESPELIILILVVVVAYKIFNLLVVILSEHNYINLDSVIAKGIAFLLALITTVLIYQGTRPRK